MLNGKQIREITTKGIQYIDDNNVEQVIDFAQCYENYVNHRLSAETWENHKKVNLKTDEDWDNYVQRVRKFREVGVKQVLTPPWADGPYIEFYTNPRTGFRIETKEEWQKIEGTVRKARYRLFDQS